jgi:hypothetical protein
MRIVLPFFMICASSAQRPYQYDAPQGRWLNNEHPPHHVRAPVPLGGITACPVDYDFCIDSRWSDDRTCMYPMPHLIKRCFDESCIQSPFGIERAGNRLEDTYCKDFMDVEGRVCQYNDAQRCECPSEIEEIVYANAVVVHQGESVPPGYKAVSECVYPSANIKRLQNGGYVDPPLPGQPAPPAIPDHPKLKGNLTWSDPLGADDVSTRPPLRPRANGSGGVGDDQNNQAVRSFYPSAAGMIITICVVFMII